MCDIAERSLTCQVEEGTGWDQIIVIASTSGQFDDATSIEELSSTTPSVVAITDSDLLSPESLSSSETVIWVEDNGFRR